MAKKGKKKQQAPQPPSSYELLGMRIQRQINAPSAQSEKTTVIARQDGEREDDWAIEGTLVCMLERRYGIVDGVWRRASPDAGPKGGIVRRMR
ncbi:DUF1654 domain-containing protein [Halomonas elongata]|uniref:DUF1654 domain-containing protein n=1 Tax=Halomonas elongata TaxID=2746 RepID=UPI00186B5F77|nr:DUF1654 domain-containing protein [Halomonas elongata]MBW5800047.1 DUF1654 domain-containing protein [Halomonas elongata]